MLIFDIVHKLVSSFMGKDVELILLILKSKLVIIFCPKKCLLLMTAAYIQMHSILILSREQTL